MIIKNRIQGSSFDETDTLVLLDEDLSIVRRLDLRFESHGIRTCDKSIIVLDPSHFKISFFDEKLLIVQQIMIKRFEDWGLCVPNCLFAKNDMLYFYVNYNELDVYCLCSKVYVKTVFLKETQSWDDSDSILDQRLKGIDLISRLVMIEKYDEVVKIYNLDGDLLDQAYFENQGITTVCRDGSIISFNPRSFKILFT